MSVIKLWILLKQSQSTVIIGKHVSKMFIELERNKQNQKLKRIIRGD